MEALQVRVRVLGWAHAQELFVFEMGVEVGRTKPLQVLEQ
jgi:hypothetical protein